MTFPRLPLLLVCTAVLFLTGCTSGFKLGGLTVAVVDLRPTDATLLETRATMTVRYTNENVLPIGISGATHRLSINGRPVGRAVSGTPLGLPQLSTTTQQVELVIENLAMLEQLRRLADQPRIEYHVESVLHVEAGRDRTNVRTRASGTLDLSAFAPAP